MTQHTIITDVPLSIAENELLTVLRVDPGCTDAGLASSLLSEAIFAARPKAVYCPSPVCTIPGESLLIGPEAVDSPFLKSLFSNEAVVYPYIATCGQELDFWKRSKSEPLEAYICDVVNDLVLQRCFDCLTEAVRSNIPKEMCLSCINPGSLPEWPLAQGQKMLFQLLSDAAGSIGVSLNEAFLMSPVKSLSGIFFTSISPFRSCMLCKKEACGARKAPFIQCRDGCC